MRLDFGDKKIAIHAGLTNELQYGVVEFKQLIEPNIDEDTNYTGKSCQLIFKDIESINTVIKSLETAREFMANNL